MFTLSTQVFTPQELVFLDRLPTGPYSPSEFLLEPTGLARLGETSLEQAQEILTQAQNLNLKIVLVCDRLLDEQYFPDITSLLQNLIAYQPYAIRVMDLGLARWLKQHFPHIPLQLILDAGFHNTLAIQATLSYWGAQVSKIILSPELPAHSLKEIISTCKVPVELLGLGRIVMFYSPRKLLSPLFSGGDQWARVSSEESQNRTFDTVQTAVGTFMFYSKDLCLLEYHAELKQLAVAQIRIDRQHLSINSLELLALVCRYLQEPSSDLLADIQEKWGRPWLPGFFKANRTSAPFVVLKNQKLQERNQNYLGWAVEVKKEKFCAVFLTKPLAEYSQIYWILPSGQRLDLTLDSQHHPQANALTQKKGVVVLPYQRKVVAGAALYGENSP